MSELILLIEDNQTNLDLMVYLLNSFGYATLTAHTGAEGLEAARKQRPGLIVCDIQLPVLDGYGVAREIKADPALRPIPLIAVTAFAMVGDSDKVLAAGFDGYIPKPIEAQRFVRDIEGYLKSRPRAPLLMPTPISESTPIASEKGIRVLVVDDAPVNLSLQRSIFEPLGYEVLTAGGMRQGLSLARQRRPDLIISDVNISGGSGFEFIRAVKSDPILKGIPFIFVTSTTRSEGDRARGLSLGAARFLFRPIEPQALLAEIESCLRR